VSHGGEGALWEDSGSPGQLVGRAHTENKTTQEEPAQ
jgi:hypothetical protein